MYDVLQCPQTKSVSYVLHLCIASYESAYVMITMQTSLMLHS